MDGTGVMVPPTGFSQPDMLTVAIRRPPRLRSCLGNHVPASAAPGRGHGSRCGTIRLAVAVGCCCSRCPLGKALARDPTTNPIHKTMAHQLAGHESRSRTCSVDRGGDGQLAVLNAVPQFAAVTEGGGGAEER